MFLIHCACMGCGCMFECKGQRSVVYIRLLNILLSKISSRRTLQAEEMNRGRAVIQLTQGPFRKFVEGKSHSYFAPQRHE